MFISYSKIKNTLIVTNYVETCNQTYNKLLTFINNFDFNPSILSLRFEEDGQFHVKVVYKKTWEL